jgi:hypothetical protein
MGSPQFFDCPLIDGIAPAPHCLIIARMEYVAVAEILILPQASLVSLYAATPNEGSKQSE